MAMTISAASCVFCGACEMECPNAAISEGEDAFAVDPERCTECVGRFDEPQCRLVCPADAIGPDPERVETFAALKEKAAGLAAA